MLSYLAGGMIVSNADQTAHAVAMEFFLAMDRVRKSWEKFTPCQSLSKSQFGVLMALQHLTRETACTGGVKITDLARELHHSLPAVSQKINMLEEAGLVRRDSKNGDRRVIYLQLTEQGQSLVHQAAERFDHRTAETLNLLGTEKTRQLLLLLQDLADAIDAINTLSVDQEG